MKRKVCGRCRIFVDGNECSLCKGQSFSTNWLGRIYILNGEKSRIAKSTNMTTPGEYAIKVR
ncbi:MAG: transcription elongation factor subunit Spt4 [Nanoarchaeota archaeon]